MDTEDWSNDAENTVWSQKKIHLQYIDIENSYFVI